jgi:FlaA1/EpsC-like NDP-sugar epimerase
LRFRNYLRIREARIASEESVIVGIIDDNLEFADRVIYSFDVLGNIHDLPSICKEKRVNRIVLACSIPHEKQSILLHIAHAYNVKVTIWSYREQELTEDEQS